MITDQERMKVDVVFVDTVIRECAQLSIQHESDNLKIEALERQIADQSAESSDFQADDTKSDLLRQRLVRAKYVIEWLMKGGGADPCSICAKKCKMGEECKPVWKEGADL